MSNRLMTARSATVAWLSTFLPAAIPQSVPENICSDRTGRHGELPAARGAKDVSLPGLVAAQVSHNSMFIAGSEEPAIDNDGAPVEDGEGGAGGSGAQAASEAESEERALPALTVTAELGTLLVISVIVAAASECVLPRAHARLPAARSERGSCSVRELRAGASPTRSRTWPHLQASRPSFCR